MFLGKLINRYGLIVKELRLTHKCGHCLSVFLIEIIIFLFFAKTSSRKVMREACKISCAHIERQSNERTGLTKRSVPVCTKGMPLSVWFEFFQTLEVTKSKPY